MAMEQLRWWWPWLQRRPAEEDANEAAGRRTGLLSGALPAGSFEPAEPETDSSDADNCGTAGDSGDGGGGGDGGSGE